MWINILHVRPDSPDRSQGTFRIKPLRNHEIGRDNGGASVHIQIISQPSDDHRTRLTDTRLTVHKHTMAIVEFRLYEDDGGHEVLQDVRGIGVVYIRFDLTLTESLFIRRSLGVQRVLDV